MYARFMWIWARATGLIAAGVGAIAYHAGVTAQLVTAGSDKVPAYPYYGGYGWGFGFGWIIPLLFFILLFSFFFRGRRHWKGGGHRPWEQRLEEWHQQQHGEPPTPPSTTV